MQREYAHLIRPLIAFLHDLAMAALAFIGAILLRLGLEDGWERLVQHLLPALALFTGVAAATFLGTGLYRGIWRYASLNDLMAIARSATLAVLIFLPFAFLLTRLEELPRSSLVIAWILLMFLLGAPRMFYRVVRDRGVEHLLERDRHLRVPALLVGTRDAAETFLREMARDRSGPYEVVGLIDEKGTRIGRRLHGVPVLGGLDALPSVIEQAARRSGRRPQRLILSDLPARPEIARLLELAEAEGLAIARLPRLAELEEGAEARLEPRPIAIEDLLGRPQTKLDRAAMARLVHDRRVAVTGAGGSIGAELTRQIAALGPAELTLIDASEFNLYTIDLEIGETWPALPRQARLLDVRDATVVERALRATRPELLFHAA
ncbi:MAG: polysaccharide biosynthesis protein, partial [Kiloniellales bacterium]